MLPTITFLEKDYKDIDNHRDVPIVIWMGMENYNVKHNLIDQDSWAKIIFDEAYKQLGLPTSMVKPYIGTLVGFSGDIV